MGGAHRERGAESLERAVLPKLVWSGGGGRGGDRRVRPGRVSSAQSAIKCLEGSAPRALIY